MKQLVRVERAAGPPRVCRHCHRSIVHVSDIGWIDAEPGESYDMCPGDTWGEHEPVVRLPSAGSDVSFRGGAGAARAGPRARG